MDFQCEHWDTLINANVITGHTVRSRAGFNKMLVEILCFLSDFLLKKYPMDFLTNNSATEQCFLECVPVFCFVFVHKKVNKPNLVFCQTSNLLIIHILY